MLHGPRKLPQKSWGSTRKKEEIIKTSYGVLEKICPQLLLWIQGGSGTEPEPETGTVGTVFPETESGTGTAGTVFQEPKPEPSFPVKLYWNTEKPFLQRNRHKRKPEPLEPFHPQTVTEPKRGLPVDCVLRVCAKIVVLIFWSVEKSSKLQNLRVPVVLPGRCPWGRLDYICNSKTNKSVSVSVIFWKLIWKQFKSVSVISGVQVKSQRAPITLLKLIPKIIKGVSVSVIKIV